MDEQKDPLDVIFLSKEEALRLQELDLRKRLANYLEKMPKELKALFWKEFERRNP